MFVYAYRVTGDELECVSRGLVENAMVGMLTPVDLVLSSDVHP